MDFRDFLNNNIVILDGGTGTLMQEAGLPAGTPPGKWNIENPEAVINIHKSYFDAGSNVVMTNTFGINPYKYSENEIDEMIIAAVDNAKKARELSIGSHEKFIALDVGPLGKLLAPIGELDFEDAVSAFTRVISIGAAAGVDAIMIETMNDFLETKCALLAAKECCVLPVMVSNAYSDDGRLLSGTSPEIITVLLEQMGADAIGVNCSFGPLQLSEIVEKYFEYSSIPVLFKPNAGLPYIKDGKTLFDVGPEEFADCIKVLVSKGLRLVGGCCGTTPEYIKKVAEAVKYSYPAEIEKKHNTVISSGTKYVDFKDVPILIGERINPTGKKKLKAALAEKDIAYILREATTQEEKGAHVLDVNTGSPEIDEKEMLPLVAGEIQAVCTLPLQIDTTDYDALEATVRRYNGIPLINSVNGKKESMEAVFNVAAKYGGSIIALTLDEEGIPETSDGRIEIAKRIIDKAEEYGIDKSRLIFDALVLTVSADNNAAALTLETIKRIRTELGCHTSLGISNVSFGLPERAKINATFFTMALENGLSAAIINPYSEDLMSAYYSWRLLKGKDENCLEYIDFAQNSITHVEATATEEDISLTEAIEKGLKIKSAELTKKLLKTEDPLALIQNAIVPALNIVGEKYESKRVFLPQLLMSAEAASYAFGEIKAVMRGPEAKKNGIKIVLATVKGDIHDIGKNIVKLLLENYGFNVIDLGRDVAPEVVVDKAIENDVQLVGLSALMTTTVPSMEATIKLLKEKAPTIKTVVGGAVLTKELAESIGADKYAKDAMETVRYAESING